MADADTSAAVPETSGDTGTDHASLSIVVDSIVWKYMEKSIRFSADVKEQISRVTDVTFEGQPDGRTKLLLKGEDGNRLNDIVDSIKQLIDSCEQTVKSVTVPKQEAVVYTNIVENLDTLQPTSGHVSVDDGNVVVTGTNEEIEQTLGMLEELYGLRRGDKGSSDDPNSLQLWKVGSIEPVCIDVDSGLWQYIKKPDSTWVKQYDQVRGNANVQLTETPTTENGGALLRIEISGMKDSVAETKAELEGLIEQCSRDIKTVRSAKLDEKVFAKACKFIPTIAKTGAVVTGIDCVISVTGNDVQIKACKEKLDKLNVNLSEAQSSQRSTAAAAATSSSVAPPTTREERGSYTASSARAVPDQSSRPADVPSSSDPRPSLSGASISRPGTAGLKHLEVPFPIEEQLWKFMQKRRSAQLQELRDVYMVNLSTLSAGEPGYVMLKMSAESDDMLEIAQESFLQFLEVLHKTIVVQAMETETGAASLPPELCQIFSQLINGLDAIIEFSGNKIFITGPRDAIVEGQQRIASFVQQQQRGQSGMGGVGNSMGMRQPQGMGMGFGMNADMGMGSGRGRGMGMGSGSMGSGERLGGRGIPGTYNDADQQTAIRNQRNMQLGGQSMYGQDSYGEFNGNFGSSGQSGRFDEPARSSANQGMTVEELVDDDDDDDELVRATCRPTGNSEQAASGQLHGVLKSSEKTESVQNVQAADSAASKHRVRFSDQQTPGQSSSASPAATTSSNASSKPAVVASAASASASHLSDTPSTNAVSHHHLSMCSVCEMSEHGSSASNSAGRCAHSFCVSCVKEYFSNSSATGPRCPVCGSDNESPASKQPRTQPSDGRMLVTHDSSFRLPGFENRSRGTITVIYSFPSGTQKDPQPHPGQKYGAVTKTAFFPMTPEGSTIVDQLQRAFDDGLVFAMVPGANGQPDQIDWNGIDHKTNIFGGPQLQGYPDPVYLPRIQNQLRAKGIQ